MAKDEKKKKKKSEKQVVEVLDAPRQEKVEEPKSARQVAEEMMEKAKPVIENAKTKLEEWEEKSEPVVNRIMDSVDRLAKKMEPAAQKAKEGMDRLADKIVYTSATVNISDQYKSFALSLNKRCERLAQELEHCELSQESKETLTDELRKIIVSFEMSMYSVLKSEEMSKDLEEVRVHVFGKNCRLSELLRSIGSYPAEDRKTVGQVVNQTRKGLEGIYEDVKALVVAQEEAERLKEETLDVTLPGTPSPVGTVHPLTRVFHELCEIFVGMGFSIKDGPEIELDEYCFDKLNIPKNHPARDMQDTFYITDDVVLRTHTSPVQVRTMLQEKPPIRILSPGRVYRSDDIDATHSPIFHQMEGLVVDKGITMAHLKGILDAFATRFFGDEIKVRLRPSYFPFTEPSAEVDLTCVACKGQGCSVCKHTGWIEVLGCGMVHPNVLRNCGIDPEEYSGFAFGMGLDRIANLKYKNSDIRLLYENDVRFLRQF